MPEQRLANEVIDIRRDERAIIVGRTGSGKTTLAKSLLTQYPYVVALDPKGRFNLPWGRVASSPEELFRQEVRPFEPQIYRPEVRFWSVDYWDEVLYWVYRRQNTTLYVDEVEGIIDAPRVPQYYPAILTRGRELNIRVISGNQRPSGIPIKLFSETDHYIMYPLQWEDDQKRMASLMGKRVLDPLPKGYDHAFWYYRVGQDLQLHQLNLGGANEPERLHSQ